jgi:glycogen synthase
VIATAWGGHTEYCDDTNSWLIDYSFQRCKFAEELGTFVWAEPLADRLDEALLRAYRATDEERLAKSQAGRMELLRRFTWEQVAMRLVTLADEAGRWRATTQ